MVLRIFPYDGVNLFDPGGWAFQILNEVPVGVEQYTCYAFEGVSCSSSIEQMA
jgi:hypothetical protein